jgi:protein TonB
MTNRFFIPSVLLFFFVILAGFKPPKNTFPKNDILYSKYGGDIDLMMREERKLDSIAHPYLYEVKVEKKEDTLSYDDESVIVEKAEIMPQFPDGEKGLKEYIASTNAFMVDTLIGKKATVTVKFYVSSLGDAKNPKIIKSDNPSFDLQTIILIDGMPKWTPGKSNGKPVNCYITLPVKYGQ